MFDRDELIRLVERIREGRYASEAEADDDIETLAANVLDPSAIDYLFQPEFDELSVTQIVDMILAYRPIRL